jgi:hypothetical protein
MIDQGRDIVLAGGERAAFEKLEASLRRASEAAMAATIPWAFNAACLKAIEGATEAGVHRAEGDWAVIATQIDDVQKKYMRLTNAGRRAVHKHIAHAMDLMLAQVRRMRNEAPSKTMVH